MKSDLREYLGRVLQEQRRSHPINGLPDWESPWTERIEESREIDRRCAEAVVQRYLEILRPGFLTQVRWEDGRRITEEEFYQMLGGFDDDTRDNVHIRGNI